MLRNALNCSVSYVLKTIAYSNTPIRNALVRSRSEGNCRKNAYIRPFRKLKSESSAEFYEPGPREKLNQRSSCQTWNGRLLGKLSPGSLSKKLRDFYFVFTIPALGETFPDPSSCRLPSGSTDVATSVAVSARFRRRVRDPNPNRGADVDEPMMSTMTRSLFMLRELLENWKEEELGTWYLYQSMIASPHSGNAGGGWISTLSKSTDGELGYDCTTNFFSCVRQSLFSS